MVVKAFDVEFVHRVPPILQEGVLYVCLECKVVVHLCACGCGEKVVLPIEPDAWHLQCDGEHVSLSPSIGNFQFPCKSHYWIKGNQVIWADSNACNSKPKRLRIMQRFIRWLKQ